MVEITLYEYEPTRSLKCRWALLEAGLEYQSIGNSFEIIGSESLKQVNPSGKVPAAIIDGRPLFESSAIVAAIADLVPELELIARPGSWERALHDQWTLFSMSELEMWAWTTVLNTRELLFDASQQVPAITDQMKMLFHRGADILEPVLDQSDYIIGNSFTVTDINLAYGLYLGKNMGYLEGHPALTEYLARLQAREHCQMGG